MESAKIVVIGAGVVGLSVAARLSEKSDAVFVLEKNAKYGQETSSHNSGVIHSGIHYLKGSLKAKLCVKGNTMTYRICEEYHIPYKRLGKLTVALKEDEIDELEKLMRQGQDNGVEGLEFLDKDEVRKLEPNINVEKALFSPSTGIVEPDELMNHYYAKASKNGAMLVAETQVTGMKQTPSGYEIEGTSVGERFTITAKAVVNCGGLHADAIAAMAGLDLDKLGYRQHPCKGDYFRLSGKPPVKMLVYPIPKGAGLGIHLTPDMGGSIRLGPNAYYVNRLDYEVESNEQEFREDVERFMPLVRERQINADSAGIRPKLQGPKDPFRDFVIKHEAEHGLFGFINLVGIESPGLTGAPAIAEFISEIYEKEINK